MFSVELKVKAGGTVDVSWEKDAPLHVTCTPPCSCWFSAGYTLANEAKPPHVSVHNPSDKEVTCTLTCVEVGDPAVKPVEAMPEKPAKVEKPASTEVVSYPTVVPATTKK